MKALVALLVLTAFSTAAVEALNWWLTPDGGYALFVRTSWALLRSLAFLVLIWQVRKGRASAPPFALILSVTTLFALGRLIVPRQGTPHVAGVLGFALVAALCGAVLFLLYRSEAVRGYMIAHRPRIVLTRNGIEWRETPPKRPPVPGRLLTVRVAALSYGPLILVAAVVAIGQIFEGRIAIVPLVVLWILGGIALTYVIALITIFLLRGKGWARMALIVVTLVVLAVDLPLCWWLLGWDGLIRDGGPLAIAAVIALTGLGRQA